MNSPADIFPAMWLEQTNPKQNKAGLGRLGPSKFATRKFLYSGHIHTQNANIKSVCRQHLLINLSYNTSTDISCLFSHSQMLLQIVSNTIFAWIEGLTIRSVAGKICPATAPAYLFPENFWMDEGFVDKRDSLFTILFWYILCRAFSTSCSVYDFFSDLLNMTLYAAPLAREYCHGHLVNSKPVRMDRTRCLLLG